MRRPAFTAALSGALILAVAAPASASPRSSVAAQLDAILAGAGSTGMSVRVDVAGAGQVFSHTASRAVAPASTQKLITAFTALRVLGPGYRFVTSVGSPVAADRNG